MVNSYKMSHNRDDCLTPAELPIEGSFDVSFLLFLNTLELLEFLPRNLQAVRLTMMTKIHSLLDYFPNRVASWCFQHSARALQADLGAFMIAQGDLD